MTDHPRFEPVSCRPEEAHRRYYGGRLVDLVVGVVEHRALRWPTGRALRSLEFEMGVPIVLVLLLLGGFAGLSAAQLPAPLQSTAPVLAQGQGAGPDEEPGIGRRGPLRFDTHAFFLP
jgi:hypothetical protein